MKRFVLGIRNKIVCLFKNHDYAKQEFRHYNEIDDLITFDKVKTCKRCGQVSMETYYEKRTK